MVEINIWKFENLISSTKTTSQIRNAYVLVVWVTWVQIQLQNRTYTMVYKSNLNMRSNLCSYSTKFASNVEDIGDVA